MARTGFIKGPGGPVDDVIPMKANEGDFVLNAPATAMVGEDQINAFVKQQNNRLTNPVDIRVSNGEALIPKADVDRIGKDKLTKLNNEGRRQLRGMGVGFAEGGQVLSPEEAEMRLMLSDIEGKPPKGVFREQDVLPDDELQAVISDNMALGGTRDKGYVGDPGVLAPQGNTVLEENLNQDRSINTHGSSTTPFDEDLELFEVLIKAEREKSRKMSNQELLRAAYDAMSSRMDILDAKDIDGKSPYDLLATELNKRNAANEEYGIAPLSPREFLENFVALDRTPNSSLTGENLAAGGEVSPALANAVPKEKPSPFGTELVRGMKKDLDKHPSAAGLEGRNLFALPEGYTFSSAGAIGFPEGTGYPPERAVRDDIPREFWGRVATEPTMVLGTRRGGSPEAGALHEQMHLSKTEMSGPELQEYNRILNTEIDGVKAFPASRFSRARIPEEGWIKLLETMYEPDYAKHVDWWFKDRMGMDNAHDTLMSNPAVLDNLMRIQSFQDRRNQTLGRPAAPIHFPPSISEETDAFFGSGDIEGGSGSDTFYESVKRAVGVPDKYAKAALEYLRSVENDDELVGADGPEPKDFIREPLPFSGVIPPKEGEDFLLENSAKPIPDSLLGTPTSDAPLPFTGLGGSSGDDTLNSTEFDEPDTGFSADRTTGLVPDQDQSAPGNPFVANLYSRLGRENEGKMDAWFEATEEVENPEGLAVVLDNPKNPNSVEGAYGPWGMRLQASRTNAKRVVKEMGDDAPEAIRAIVDIANTKEGGKRGESRRELAATLKGLSRDEHKLLAAAEITMKKGTDKMLDAYLSGDVQAGADVYLTKYVTGKVPDSYKNKVYQAFRDKFNPPEVAETVNAMAEGGFVSRKKLFNPQGSEYDYSTAHAYGMGPDGTGENKGHYGSVAPASQEIVEQYNLPKGTYMMLKGKNHPTWHKAVAAEKARGSAIGRLPDGRYYSVPSTD